jgi:hypothetical protein
MMIGIGVELALVLGERLIPPVWRPGLNRIVDLQIGDDCLPMSR